MICFPEYHYVFLSLIRTFLRQIEKHLADRFSGDAVQRAATPAGGKQHAAAAAAAAAAASSVAAVSSPLARIQEDEEELSSPDVTAKLEVRAHSALVQNCVYSLCIPFLQNCVYCFSVHAQLRLLSLSSPPLSSPSHLQAVQRELAEERARRGRMEAQLQVIVCGAA
jgi:hypothetical protein